MGEYKNLKIELDENKLDVIDMMLIIFLIIALLFSLYLVNENDKLLKQVDEAMGKYNEICYQADLINNAYEELKEKYEYAIEVIRTSDKYDLPEGMEE